MRLTSKGRYAVRAILDLTFNSNGKPVRLQEISERQKISLSYLEQLFGKLRRHQIVESVRGPGGGYFLARPSQDISIADIIVAVDEPLDATKCGGKANCHDDRQCVTHNLWTGLNESIYAYLSAVSLKQVVDSQHADKKNNVRPVTLSKKMLRHSPISVR